MAKKMSSKNKFSYEQAENIDAVFNYLSMVNKGLKNRHLSLGDDAQLLELALPEQVKLTIKAQVKSTKGSLGIELSWQMPEEELLPVGAVDQAPTALTDDVKTHKKAEKKRLKAAEQALKLAAKDAAKAAKESRDAAKAAAAAAKKKDRAAPEKAVKRAVKAEKIVSKATKNQQSEQTKTQKKPKLEPVAAVQGE